MKGIFLNSWQAKTGDKFFEFIKNESPSTDIFCLMETSPPLHAKIVKILEGYDNFYSLGGTFTDGIKYGQSGFFRKELNANLEKEIGIKDGWCGKIISYQAKTGNNKFRVINVHGLSQPGNKLDTEERLKQSQTILDLLKDSKTPIIIGGDFNLMPKTKSVMMFEKTGYKNLIKEFNIKSTRNKISWEQYKDHPGFKKQYFADYCFTSREVKVKSFKVPYNEVSDHLPLILDFEL